MEILQTLEFRIEGQRTYLRENWSMIFVNGAMTNYIFSKYSIILVGVCISKLRVVSMECCLRIGMSSGRSMTFIWEVPSTVLNLGASELTSQGYRPEELSSRSCNITQRSLLWWTYKMGRRRDYFKQQINSCLTFLLFVKIWTASIFTWKILLWI